MKLELKRMPGVVGSFALYVNDELVPAQIDTTVTSIFNETVKIIVRFQSIPGQSDTVQIVGDDDPGIDDHPGIDDPGIDAINHEKHVQGDEYYCILCGKRWGTDEPEPECF